MLKQRIIFGALGVVLAVGVLTFGNVEIIGVCVALLAIIGLYEFYNVTGLLSKKVPAVALGFLYCVACSCVAILCNPEQFKEFISFSVISFAFISMIFTVLFHSKNSFSDSSLSFLGTIYITVFFLHIILIRNMNFGKCQIWFAFIPAWATDTFAYIAGRLFGKHKLCPKVSPKKTVEGAIGGVVGCIIGVALYSYFCSRNIGCSVNYINVLIFSIVVSVVSQFGDLAASCIKREHGAKDYGNLIPGHGGVLDRFDSVILIAPVVYYLLTYLPVFC